MYLSDQWKDYQLLDCGDGKRLEKWSGITILRPDPQAIWPMQQIQKFDAHSHHSSGGNAQWEYSKELPENWQVSFNELRFLLRLTGFKHTGIFPEQAVNWLWMQERINAAKSSFNRPIKVLNLFAYTGAATLACLSAGAEVVHVDAAKSIVALAKENSRLSKLDDRPVRWIVDDVLKFVKREARRQQKYDAIIMDPPSYGRGPGGEIWKIEASLYSLIEACMEIVSDTPVFFLINSYTTGLAPSILKNVLHFSMKAKYGGYADADEIGLPVQNRPIIMPCGSSGRWWIQKS